MKENVLVRNGHHMRPMLAVCRRYGVGFHDKYDRGVWISKTDVDTIGKMMETDPTAIRGVWNGKPWLAVNGTNRHNQVVLRDFEELFQQKEL